MSTSFYLWKPISISDFESKTEIRLNQKAHSLVFGEYNISVVISDDGKNILQLIRYHGMNVFQIIHDLASKVGVEIMSEYAFREYLETVEPIPEAAWMEYTSSIIAAIKKPE